MKRKINLFGEPVIEDFIPPALPYMGNKRKLATKLLNAIYRKVGDFENFYDLFGGGGSMSMTALIAGHKVVYNELNTGVCNLMKHLQSGGKIPYNWVSREEFFERKDDDDWYGGLVKTVWSFGNDQSSYLFSKDVEETKRLAHEMLVNNNKDARDELGKLLGVDLSEVKTRHSLNRLVKRSLKSRICELEQLQQLERLERLQHLEQLERLERLQHLEHLQHLQQLEIKNQSYNEITIDKNSVIYCDPPYEGTGEYQCDKFNHDVFYEWCLKQDNPVFISGYSMPAEFELIAQFKHRSTLSATANNEVIENLYWNKKLVRK